MVIETKFWTEHYVYGKDVENIQYSVTNKREDIKDKIEIRDFDFHLFSETK